MAVAWERAYGAHRDAGRPGRAAKRVARRARLLIAAFALVALGGLAAAAVASASGYEVVSWGGDQHGQLGDGLTGLANNSDVPVHVCEAEWGGSGQCPAGHYLSGVIAISAGGERNLALLASGEVVSWGLNKEGALGTGNTSNPKEYDRPEYVCTTEQAGLCPAADRLKEVVAVAAGDRLSNMALLKSGEVVTWGSNKYGNLGNGTIPSASSWKRIPVKVCALTVAFNTPCGGSYLTQVTGISAAPDHDAAIVGADAEAVSWGVNNLGQLGQGDYSKYNDQPRHVCQVEFSSVLNSVSPESPPACEAHREYLTGVISMSFGLEHNLALLRQAEHSEQEAFYGHCSNEPSFEAINCIVGWGNNEEGQLGDGVNAESNNDGPNHCTSHTPCSEVPVHVCEVEYTLNGSPCPSGHFLFGAQEISAGGSHSLELSHAQYGEQVMAWGENRYGTLGNDSTSKPNTCTFTSEPCSPVPVQVCEVEYVGRYDCLGEVITKITAISAGSYHNLVLESSGRVAAWGENGEGQLGDHTTALSDVPEPVCAAGYSASGRCWSSLLTDVKGISAGSDQSLAMGEF